MPLRDTSATTAGTVPSENDVLSITGWQPEIGKLVVWGKNCMLCVAVIKNYLYICQ